MAVVGSVSLSSLSIRGSPQFYHKNFAKRDARGGGGGWAGGGVGRGGMGGRGRRTGRGAKAGAADTCYHSNFSL